MDKASGAYRTISEVGEELDIPQHVLRFWETRFSQIKPMKRSGGRRYYRPADVLLLKGIRRLLYGEGYTIKGVQRILATQGVGVVQRAGSGEGEGEELAGAADLAATDDVPAAAGASPSNGKPRRDDLDTPGREPRETPSTSEAMPQTWDLFQDQAPFSPSPPPSVPALSASDRRSLQSALDDLSECARLLDLLREAGREQAPTPDRP
jgi:DNA-binding transcriptional MerR regulator